MRALVFWIALSAWAQNWPSFRGPAAAGNSDKQNLPLQWDAQKGTNVRWKTPIAGLAHSSPIVWGDRVFVTTAVSSMPEATFKRGLYGAGTASDDLSKHKWLLICLDLRTGKVLWERLAYEGVPKEKRHIKSTYANSTPVTDGEVVVAFFGSQGLYAFDMNGKPLWKRELGRLDAGAYDSPDYEWGTASSPILYKDLVIVQADQQKGSFLVAVDKRTGAISWKTERDELPSWGTPNVYTGKPGPELVTNGSNFIRGYAPESGKELWRLGGSSKITAPTPVFSGQLMIVASGRRPEAPIFALRAGAKGEEVYRQRISHAGSGFSASPVASDGRIFLPGEDGEIFVAKAGPQFEILGKNEMGEPLMATPAIAAGLFIVRTEKHLWAIGPKDSI